MSEQSQVAEAFLQESIRAFVNMKKLADKALAQTAEAHFYLTLDEESNSLEVLIKHMHGNMRSRWTDFLTTDGEKETRERDGEFEGKQLAREALISLWEEGWAILFQTLESLTAEDVLKIVLIRGEGHTVLQAIQRQVSHYGYHVGQIVFLSKHWASAHWQTLSIARGQSKSFKP
ncbi:hypothetical protein BC351_11310 [Paenibacillus ferrarius]|uniref:DUF1572 domain-containing protein n=1 Tax=Paenibacillus ferrarius TaxID=1469647 RepID=A0A1V4H7A2_9BACL|nr:MULTISPECIES: DUF1572 family protein [Paenibacillus]NQX64827.1 DUF1572 family protein [Paenibacillus alba]OPH47093.1 hypothetical protein BC351_11310 [Paenibacillus ferrarius]